MLDKIINLFNSTYRVKVPTILQMEATECGAASLAMIFAHYGLWLPLETVRIECGVNRDGSKASFILRAARHRNCKADGYKFSPDRIKELNIFPLIIHWEFNYFVVLHDKKNKGCDFMSATIVFRHVDQLGKKYTENFYANDRVINTNIDSDTAVAIDTFLRAVVNLTTNTYAGGVEAFIAETKSLDEIIEGVGENNG